MIISRLFSSSGLIFRWNISIPIGVSLIVVGLFFLVFNSDISVSSDGLVRYDAVINFFRTGEITPMAYSYIGPLFSFPLYLVGIEYVKYFNLTIFVLTVILSAYFMKSTFSYDFIVKFLLLAVSGSMFSAYVRDFWGEPFSACALFLGLLTYFYAEKKVLSIFFISIAVANTPVLVVPVFIFSLALYIKKKQLWLLAFVLVPVLLVMLENYLKFGTYFNSVYSLNHGVKTLMPYSALPNFSYPMFFGVLSIILSFGKGLLFFTPGIFFSSPFNKNEKGFEVWLSLVVIAICMVLIYSKWWAWYGGVSWGPRFFLILTFMNAFVLAKFLSSSVYGISLLKLFGVMTATILSLYIGFNGHVFEWSWFSICIRDNYVWEPFNWYVPEFSILWYPFVFTDFLNNDYARYYLMYSFAVGIYLLFPFLRLLFGFMKKTFKLSKVDN